MHEQITGPGFVVSCGMGSTLQALGTICLPVLVHGSESYQQTICSSGLCGTVGGREGRHEALSTTTVTFVVVEGTVSACGDVRYMRMAS
jgi:hypothetical protein